MRLGRRVVAIVIALGLGAAMPVTGTSPVASPGTPLPSPGATPAPEPTEIGRAHV